MQPSSPLPPTRVIIDAACDIHYASYYIQGLWEVFGQHHTQFGSRPFSTFRHSNKFFCFILQQGGITRQVVIDYGDADTLHPEAYAWADVYGKVNVAFGDPNRYPKLVPIGPGFGLRLWGTVPTLWYATLNLLRSFGRIPNKRRFLSDYKAQWKRLPLSAYLQRQPGQAGYIFFVASIWKKEAKTNASRAAFMRACRQPGIHFEGGFAPRVGDPVPGFEDLTMQARTTMHSYVQQTHRSMVVFNTPAVLSCHGWKLAEFLAMGKCILSEPLSRELPAPLIDGKQLLITNNSQASMENLVSQLLANADRRAALEKEAAAYFDQYLAPAQVICRMVDSR